MEEARKPEIKEILKLLGSLTDDPSLGKLADFGDPQVILNSFRDLWEDFISPAPTLKLDFLDGDFKPGHPYANTWIVEDYPSEVKCEGCGNGTELVIQIDTNDYIFFQDLSPLIFRVHRCEECQSFTVKTSTLLNEDVNEDARYSLLVSSTPYNDAYTQEFSVPVPIPGECGECGTLAPLEMGKAKTRTFRGSKSGGIHIETYMESLKVYQDAKRDRKKQIVRFSSEDIKALQKYGISSIVMYESFYIEVNSQNLELDSDTITFENGNEIYHVVASDNKHNGSVFRTKVNDSTIVLVGYLDSFIFTDKLGYKFAGVAGDDIITDYVKEYRVAVNMHPINKIGSFIRNAIKEMNGTIDLVSNEDVTANFGDDHYISDIQNLGKMLVKYDDRTEESTYIGRLSGKRNETVSEFTEKDKQRLSEEGLTFK
jgi:hypothetical protein